MKMISVNSSNISAIGYENGVLHVRFNKGQTYAYSGVPEDIFRKLLSAPSCGEFFTDNIKRMYQCQRIS